MPDILTYEEYKKLQGKQLGVSPWLTIDQDRIDKFADVTDDHQFIHVDPKKAKSSIYGSTIAHGYLTLSLLTKFAVEAMPAIDEVEVGLNYGLNRLRFLNPVKVNQAIRGVFALKSVEEKKPGHYLSTVEVTFEIKDQATPACIAEWLVMGVTGRR